MPSSRTEDLELEGAVYIGTVLSAVFYGIYLGVYSLSISALLENMKTTRLRRNAYILFSSILLLLNTIYFIYTPYNGQLVWIVTRSTRPGGPFAYYANAEGSQALVSLLSNVAQTLAATLNDGIMAYRCYVVFGSKLYIVVLPVLCTLGSLALGLSTILLLLNLQLGLASTYELNAAAIMLNTVVNVMVTTMISFRIISVSRLISKSINSAPAYARTYTNVVAILIESAAPCAILGVLTCIEFFIPASNATTTAFVSTSNAIVSAWGMSLVLFPQLVIYRVASGSAWTERTSGNLTQATGSLAFASRTINTTMSDLESNALAEGAHF